jgi:hypothetical protein
MNLLTIWMNLLKHLLMIILMHLLMILLTILLNPERPPLSHVIKFVTTCHNSGSAAYEYYITGGLDITHPTVSE